MKKKLYVNAESEKLDSKISFKTKIGMELLSFSRSEDLSSLSELKTIDFFRSYSEMKNFTLEEILLSNKFVIIKQLLKNFFERYLL